MTIVYRSLDNGELYNDVGDDTYGFEVFEIPDTVQLTAAQCLGHDGDIIEILLGAHQARKLATLGGG